MTIYTFNLPDGRQRVLKLDGESCLLDGEAVTQSAALAFLQAAARDGIVPDIHPELGSKT